MRTARGKGNDSRKVLTYYSINFDIHPPFQVLCDGPIISLSIRNNLYLKQSLPKLLGSTAYPVVTDCIVSELKSLGEDFSGAALFAKRLTRVPCPNDACREMEGNATACILARLRKRDDLRLMLATTDADIMRNLTTIAGVPLITVENQTKLVLRPPGRETLEYVKKTEGNKGTLVSAPDRVFLNKIHAEAIARMPPKKLRRESLKRKRAKAPNPLSVKKAKRAKTNHDGQHKRVTSDVSASPGNPYAHVESSEAVTKAVIFPDTVDKVNGNTGQPGLKKDKPVPDSERDDAKLVDLSVSGDNTPQATLLVASKDIPRRKRPRNRKTVRSSKPTREDQPPSPDCSNQVASTQGAGDDASDVVDNNGRSNEVSEKAEPDDDCEGQGEPSNVIETQTISKLHGEQLHRVIGQSSSAIENYTATDHENQLGTTAGEFDGKERSAAVEKAETEGLHASKALKLAASENTSIEDATKGTDLPGAKTEMGGAAGKNPEYGKVATKLVAGVGQKKKHRNNRRRRPKKSKDPSTKQESAPSPAKDA